MKLRSLILSSSLALATTAAFGATVDECKEGFRAKIKSCSGAVPCLKTIGKELMKLMDSGTGEEKQCAKDMKAEMGSSGDSKPDAKTQAKDAAKGAKDKAKDKVKGLIGN